MGAGLAVGAAVAYSELVLVRMNVPYTYHLYLAKWDRRSHMTI